MVRHGLGLVRISTWLMLVALVTLFVTAAVGPMLKPSARDRFEAVGRSLDTGQPIPGPTVAEHVFQAVEAVVAVVGGLALSVGILLLWVGLAICIAAPREARVRRLMVGSLSCSVMPGVLLVALLVLLVLTPAPAPFADHHANDYLIPLMGISMILIFYFALAGPVLLALFLRKALHFLGHHELDGSVKGYLFFEGTLALAYLGVLMFAALLAMLSRAGDFGSIGPLIVAMEMLLAPILIFVHFFWLQRMIGRVRKIVAV